MLHSRPPNAPIAAADAAGAAIAAAWPAPARGGPPIAAAAQPPGCAARGRRSDVPVLRTKSRAASCTTRPAWHHAHQSPCWPRPCPRPPPCRVRSRPRSMGELRSMRGLIEQRFGALAFMEKLQRQPRQAQLSQRLLDAGFSPAPDPQAGGQPARRVRPGPGRTQLGQRRAGAQPAHRRARAAPLEDAGGVFALIGATGVGKTTSTAKLAAAFAARHGAAELGLVTLDAYRVGAHEQLRTYGRILGVPVHTAHDRAALEDLLDLLAAKRMVLIDTAGMAQRDSRTRELLDMLPPQHQPAAGGECVGAGRDLEDQLAAYRRAGCRGVVLSKLDEAVKLGPASGLDDPPPPQGAGGGQRPACARGLAPPERPCPGAAGLEECRRRRPGAWMTRAT